MNGHPSASREAGPEGPAAYLGLGGQLRRPCLALHLVGFAWPPCRHGAGALLPHHFTLTGRGLTCGPRRRRCISVALSRGFPRVGVTDHHALRCPDFPRAGFLSDPQPSSQRHPMVAGYDDPGRQPMLVPQLVQRNAPPPCRSDGCMAPTRRHWPSDPHMGQVTGFAASRPSHTRSRRCSSVVGLSPPEGPGRCRGASSRPGGRWVSRKSRGRCATAVLTRPS